MRRKLFTLAAGVSAVLCAGVCVLWVRSYWRADVVQVQWAKPPGTDGSRLVLVWETNSMSGWMEFSRGHDDWSAETLRRGTLPPEWLDSRVWHKSYKGGRREWEGHRLIRFAGWKHATASYSAVLVPHWILGVALAAAPAAWLAQRYSTRRRRRAGLCPACGYDLRATPGRCPECGAVPAAKGERA